MSRTRGRDVLDACHFQIAFSKNASVPEAGSAAIDNKALCEAVLESTIGESPEVKQNLAARVAELMKLGTFRRR